ncbi:carbohydrate ABC transporter permease [Sporosarcina sp. BI001-red]|uniref:carbohydrate ABC transporter permease n=1 Tax=Sporosarcina sp. BI001-red TaxID=2282866 RepID=UPI000E281A0B|nr:carbohydrate ABC transporter permease [Sporosarcina sp. BI001-red]REB10102.1 carbohydrate ABC transporter permease [Sporosarcina sp. BI001-red]
MSKSKGIKQKSSRLILRIVLLAATFIFVYPFVWNLLASFKTNKEIMTSPWGIPAIPQFANFTRAFKESNMGGFIINSFLVTGLSMLLLLILVIPTAYALSRFDFKGRKVLHNFYMAGLFIQPVYIMIPLFLMMNNLHLLDNRFWLSLVYAAGALPFSIYLLTGFMRSIPKEFEESAFIDGSGYFRTLISIIVPLAKPGILTVIIFNFFTFWNEYALALVLISSDAKKTIPVGLANLMEVQRFATDWAALFAGLVLVLLPTITLYALTQKKLTEGMSMGGLKG